MTHRQNSLFPVKKQLEEYHPRKVDGFEPTRIVFVKGSDSNGARRCLADRICATYPEAKVIVDSGTPHNRVQMTSGDLLGMQEEGKRTLVLAEHKSAVRQSTEEGNSCPNFWHFSPYGSCPYDCAYCYLAGTQGVRFSPTVKIFLNLLEILAEVDQVARRLGKPTAFYLGKLQDGLALDPLTGYSRQIIPFFAKHQNARLTMLTKSVDVENLLDLDHRGHAILSWTVNPAPIIEMFEKKTPPLEKRIAAMEAVSRAGYPVRAVVMPIIPIADWLSAYKKFLTTLLSRVRLQRITLGSICSYAQAMRLTEQKLGPDNPISEQLDRDRMGDGRIRFPQKLREDVYRHLVRTIRRHDKTVEIGLCLEDPMMFSKLGMEGSVGRCNCVL